MIDAVLVLGSTMRLTRLVTVDDLGGWTIRYPAYRWAGENTKRAQLVSGLDCPFCVGFWIGAVVLLLPRKNRVVRWLLSALTLNEVAAHVMVLIGDKQDALA